MPLVSQDRLEESLENFVIRNQLISELSQSPGSDPDYFSHLMLAILLGSNFALAVLEQDLEYEQYLFAMAAYNCAVILEKNISYIQHQIDGLQSEAIECLRNIFLEMLSEYNQNSSKYAADFAAMIDYFKGLIEKLSEPDIEDKRQQNILTKTVSQCQEVLSNDSIDSYKINAHIHIYEDPNNDYGLEYGDVFNDKAPFLIKRGDRYSYTLKFKDGQSTHFIQEKETHIFETLPFEQAILKEIYPLSPPIRRYLNSKTKGSRRIALKYTGPFDSQKTMHRMMTGVLSPFSTLKQTVLRQIADGGFGFHDLYTSQMLPLHIKQFQCQTILLKTSDHVMVEGLHAIQRERDNPFNTVTLLQIARLPAESSPIVSSLMNYARVFGSEMVFVNPRNYANHASVPADSITDIGKDIATFAAYFHQLGKHIILYAHCGSVSWITSAKAQLDEMGIHVKIIVDRAPDKMSQYYDVKTQIRMTQLRQFALSNNKKHGLRPLPLSKRLYFFGYHGMVSTIVRLCLTVTDSDQKISNLLAKMPIEDYLVLQGKSKKIAGAPYPQSVDEFVHPENDSRRAMKPVRDKTKAMLKDLYTRCCHLANLFCDNASEQQDYYQLANIFTGYLVIMVDEKLQKQNEKDINTIHTCRICELTTRSGIPTANYIQSFMAPPCQDVEDALLRLYGQAKKTVVRKHVNASQYYLVKLCHKMEQNHGVILSMASQAKRREQSDILPLIQRLTWTLIAYTGSEKAAVGKEALANNSGISSWLPSFFQRLQGNKRARDELPSESGSPSLKSSRLS